MKIVKRCAAIILFSFVGIVMLSMGAAGGVTGEWAPRLKDLELMSLRSAVLVNLATITLIAGLIYIIVT